MGCQQLGSELPQNMWGAMKEGDFNSPCTLTEARRYGPFNDRPISSGHGSHGSANWRICGVFSSFFGSCDYITGCCGGSGYAIVNPQ